MGTGVAAVAVRAAEMRVTGLVIPAKVLVVRRRASPEAVERRRANRRAAKAAREFKASGARPARAAARPRPSGSQRAAARATWEERVAGRMGVRYDPEGRIELSRRNDYRYWQCKVAGYDADAPVFGFRWGGKLRPTTRYTTHAGRVVENATVFDWWCDQHPETREFLRRGRAIVGEDLAGQLFTQPKRQRHADA